MLILDGNAALLMGRESKCYCADCKPRFAKNWNGWRKPKCCRCVSERIAIRTRIKSAAAVVATSMLSSLSPDRLMKFLLALLCSTQFFLFVQQESRRRTKGPTPSS